MTGFVSVSGDLTGALFVTDYWLIDRYVGDALWTWGFNTNGQLGDNSRTSRSSPVQTVAAGTNWKQVAAGSASHTAAIKTDGTLWLWGFNNNGQLGDNTVAAKSSPVQTVAAGTNWKQVAAGGLHTSAIKNDGTLWSWGLNTSGQLGDNSIVKKSSPVQTVAAGSNWKQVAAGYNFTAAIKTDGTLWSWGSNANGNMGDNTVASKSSPVQTVAGGTNWKQVAAGYVTAAIKTDGTLWLWGLNSNGNLGDNTVANKSSPVQTVAGGTTWKQVAAGDFHTAAIKTDGTLWLWGLNTDGQIGDNSIVKKSSPVQTVAAGTNWKQVSGGEVHTAAIKTDGTLWLWGRNNYGNLGDNTVASKSSPVQTVAGGTNWKQVAAGNGHNLAVLNNAT